MIVSLPQVQIIRVKRIIARFPMFMLEIAAPIDWKSKTISERIEGSHTQSAKFWKLRATTRLTRVQSTEDRDLLAPLYGWFTEGLDTADLKEAKALLEKLS